MEILVTGGAGYIGSHTVKELQSANHQVIVIDDLSSGNCGALNSDVIFYEGNINDVALLNRIFKKHNIKVVMNFAADISVAESVNQPLKYFKNNSSNFIVLLDVMRQNNIKNIVFSSTAAVYGEVDGTPILETHSLAPINPYGFSKMVSEKILQFSADAYNLNYVIFRYFNVAGADKDGKIGLVSNKEPLTHLIPVVVENALGIRNNLLVYGSNLNTRDGSCIRDYIHVSDLAYAHVLAIKKLVKSESGIYNLGSNSGYSVLEVINTCQEIIGEKIKYSVVDRRPGDPIALVANATKAIDQLHWVPKYKLYDIIKSDLAWRKKLIAGFKYE